MLISKQEVGKDKKWAKAGIQIQKISYINECSRFGDEMKPLGFVFSNSLALSSEPGRSGSGREFLLGEWGTNMATRLSH